MLPQLTLMSLTMCNHANTSHVTTTNNHCHVTSIKFDEINHFAGLDIHDDGVVNRDQGIRVSDGASIMGHNVWHAFGSNIYSSDTSKLVL